MCTWHENPGGTRDNLAGRRDLGVLDEAAPDSSTLDYGIDTPVSTTGAWSV